MNKIYLTLKENQYLEAKQCGAVWDNNNSLWYTVGENATRDIIKWIPSKIIKNNLIIMEGIRSCWRCHKETEVYSVTSDYILDLDLLYSDIDESENDTQMNEWIKEFIDNYNNYLNINNRDNIYQPSDFFSDDRFKKIFQKFAPSYYWDYSKFIKDYDHYNHCKHCGIIQGNFYVYDEIDDFNYVPILIIKLNILPI